MDSSAPRNDQADSGYWCVVCGRFLPEQDGVIVHDPIPHPPTMRFDDEDYPQ